MTRHLVANVLLAAALAVGGACSSGEASRTGEPAGALRAERPPPVEGLGARQAAAIKDLLPG